MASSVPQAVSLLKEFRPFLLLCEAIGLFHMAGKAKMDFLKYQADQIPNYDYTEWPNTKVGDPDLLSKILGSSPLPQHLHSDFLPGSWCELIKQHAGSSGKGLLGLLQAAHGMTSGIEKQSYPPERVRYLAQKAPHLWLSSAFGTPERNLLTNPPDVLTDEGWNRLIDEIRGTFKEALDLKDKNADVDAWIAWRNRLVGSAAFIRTAFLSTLAETRLPNNDVTLWDQSYVAAALFKSAIAGALLDSQFSPSDQRIKSNIRWRLLTVGIGSDYYEARAVKIGDWTGTARILEEFFERVQHLIEVELALGSLIYRDTHVCIFTFPGEPKSQQPPASWIESKDFSWQKWLEGQIDALARAYDLETPPYCSLSAPTRSLVPIVKARHDADLSLSIPVHRHWLPRTKGQDSGHVCPVCNLRRNGDPSSKDRPCEICLERRAHRLRDWLEGKLGSDTIWLDEVADSNNRLALITMQLDVVPWLEGERIDSLRAQAIPEWLKHNPDLDKHLGQAQTPETAFTRLYRYVQSKISQFNKDDPVLKALNQGFKYTQNWPTFFADIVEDRTKEPLNWNSLTYDKRAAWLCHQLLRKLPAPGRIYRFWRQSQAFFESLYHDFSKISADHPNNWRVKRLGLVPKNKEGLSTNHLYESVIDHQPCTFLFDGSKLITTTNLARLFSNQATFTKLQTTLNLSDPDDPRRLSIQVEIEDVDQAKDYLSNYHPVIRLELSPLRFRILVPLEAASACVDHAIREWNQQFARVKDRLPLHIGVVAFPNKMSFQAVLEMVRTIEKMLESSCQTEIWTVLETHPQNNYIEIEMKRPDQDIEEWRIPHQLPDQRQDVFYPYFETDEKTVRFDLDFQTPQGSVFRYVSDLRPDDKVRVSPSRIITVFMDTTARRFEKHPIYYVSDWVRMRQAWQILDQIKPPMSQLQSIRQELGRLAHEWDIHRDPIIMKTWLALARALLIEALNPSPSQLDSLIREAQFGRLLWTIDWHMNVTKQKHS